MTIEDYFIRIIQNDNIKPYQCVNTTEYMVLNGETAY